jgi:hypothetical protein
MLLGVDHGEGSKPVGLGSELSVPIRLAEATADAVDGCETFRIADGDFIGGDPYHAAVLGV